MLAPGTLRNNGLTGKINIICLLAAIAIVLILPLHKQLWYDETISILCSKGISHDAASVYKDVSTISSTTISRLNTVNNVFDATVNDNANSFIYNLGLHWFSAVSGNSVWGFMFFSKLIAIASLIGFWYLCRLLLGNNLFTSLAILLLVIDIDFIAMSHEVRAYMMGILFVTLSVINYYKFMYRQEKASYLLLTGLFGVGAVLSHFLSVYIIVVLVVCLIFHKNVKLLKPFNLLALLLPVALIAAFFWRAYPGLQTMNRQNADIQHHTLAAGFNAVEVLFRAMKFTAINFKAVFPSFSGARPVVLGAFLLVVVMYVAGIRAAADKEQKRNLNLLFLLGAGSSLFLSILCLKSHHYTALYYRYFSFCLPFCALFVAYLLFVLNSSSKYSRAISLGLGVVLILPSLALFFTSLKNANTQLKYNHGEVARLIEQGHASKIEVPEWRDAFLINCLLPQGYKIDYFRNPAASGFTITKPDGEIKLPVIRIDE